MIERLYADNFRCLVNCEIPFTPVTLLLGQNGGGKSSVFDILQAIKGFVGGISVVSDCFAYGELTRWQSLSEQKFELDIRSPSGLFRYSLKLEHEQDRKRSRVASEQLTLEGQPLFICQQGEVQLFNDGFKPGPVFSFDWNRSGLAAVHARHDNKKLNEFKFLIQRMMLVRPNPPMMVSDSQEESDQLSSSGSNFSSWYRFVSRQDIGQQIEFFRELQDVIDGFESVRLEGPADGTATLRVQIRTAGQAKPISYKLAELSDGQRQLLLLYALVFGQRNEDRTLLFDEPDNYLSLREVQPWLGAVVDQAGRGIGQAVLISHHPEVVDHLAKEKGVWLERDGNGPVRVRRGSNIADDPLTPSEVQAREWAK